MTGIHAPEVAMIWAEARGGVIGNDGVMPWRVPEDLEHFKHLTAGCPVLMGRATWDSLPPRFRPLPGRRNIVITRDIAWAAEGAEAAHSRQHALALASADQPATIWITGGATIYAEFMPLADRLEVTEIDADISGDTVAPGVGDQWHLVAAEPEQGFETSRGGLDYRFLTYRRTRTR